MGGKKTATYKITPDTGGNRYRFYCDVSGALVCITSPYHADIECTDCAPFEYETRYCKSCGAKIDAGAEERFCPVCKQKLHYEGS